jgi:isopropylmalate/homocitrate/citramalate synthase
MTSNERSLTLKKTKAIVLSAVSLCILLAAGTAAAGPDKEQAAALRSCIEATANLSKVSKEAADLLMEARKGGKADAKKYQGIMKAVENWMSKVPERCKGMEPLLADLKQSGVDQKAILKCYDAYEKVEDKCVATAKKNLSGKKVQSDQKAQKKIIGALHQCVAKGQKPLATCIGKNSTGNKKAVASLNTRFDEIKNQYEKCWNACWEKNMKEADMTTICDNECQKESDHLELGALKDFIKEISD